MTPIKLTPLHPGTVPTSWWLNPMHVTHWFANTDAGSTVVLVTGQMVAAKETPEEVEKLFGWAVNGVPAIYRPPS